MSDHEASHHPMKTILWPILRRCLRHPGRVAVVDDQRAWKYGELLFAALHLAGEIERRSSRERIGVMLPIGGSSPLAFLAVWLAGRVPVPLNYLQSHEDRQYVIGDSELDLVLTAGRMIEFVGKAPECDHVVKVEELDIPRPRGAMDLLTRCLPPLRFPPVALADDTAVILYTSGTSGRPKGVMLTHRNLRTNVDLSIRHLGVTASDGFLGVLPQFHSFGLTALTLIPLRLGAKVVFTSRFMPRKLLELIREHKPDVLMAIPSMYGAMMTAKAAKAEDMASVRLAVSGGEPLSADVRTRFEEKFGVAIREGYGLTETSPIASFNTLTEHRPGSVGKPIPQCRIRIVADDGRELEPEQEGEIQIAGPNIMAGYFRQPDLTAQVIDGEGYFKTGDWGKFDRDGYLYITGRKKEMLIIGGENVFPREIEEVLNLHPSVAASAVVGASDPVRGEVPVAFVEPAEGATVDEGEVRSWCRERMAGFKVPREVRVIEKLPRNPTGKILRRELRVS
jgi:long-chain acyl-CoA synthetase